MKKGFSGQHKNENTCYPGYTTPRMGGSQPPGTSNCQGQIAFLPYTSSNPAQETVHVSSEHIHQKEWISVKHNTCNCICQLSGQGQREQRYRPGAKPNALALAPGPVRPCNPGINDQPELADQDTTERGHKSFFGRNEADSTNHHKDELTLPQRRSSTRLYVRVDNRSVVGCQGVEVLPSGWYPTCS